MHEIQVVTLPMSFASAAKESLMMKSSRAVLIIMTWVVLTNPGLVAGADSLLIVGDGQEEPQVADKRDSAEDEKNITGNKLRQSAGAANKSTRYGVGYEFRIKKSWQTGRSRGSGRSFRSSRSGRRR